VGEKREQSENQEDRISEEARKAINKITCDDFLEDYMNCTIQNPTAGEKHCIYILENYRNCLVPKCVKTKKK
jgi:hypothetical protein